MRYCSNCGSQMEDNARFCNKCGCSINPPSNETTPNYQTYQPPYQQPYQQNNFSNITPQKKPLNTPLIVVTIIAIAAIVALIIVLIQYTKSDSDSDSDKNSDKDSRKNYTQEYSEDNDSEEDDEQTTTSGVIVTEPETELPYFSGDERFIPIDYMINGLNNRDSNVMLNAFPEEYRNLLAEDISDLISEVSDYDQLYYDVYYDAVCSQSELNEMNQELNAYGIVADEAYYIGIDIYTSADPYDTESAEFVIGYVDGDWYIVNIMNFM